MKKQQLSALPQIETLLQQPDVRYYSEKLGRPVVAEIIRSVVDSLRRTILDDDSPDPEVSLPGIIAEVAIQCRLRDQERLQKVINATGIIIHTNMGRAPLPKEVWREAEAVNCGYSNLEMVLATGKRGKRKGLIPSLLAQLTGAESALVVNNNAAAVFLLLNTFARDKEVIVSRGEQVQIGGGFRIPEILAQSGAGLTEIGTTNITTLNDYVSAFTEKTAMILSVHRSNFAIRGFTSAPSVAELSAVKPENVLLCVDQGSGVIDETLPGETSVRSHLKNGADLVSFSGDKILGGPQAGIIAGKRELIDAMEKHPLMRVFRPGKTVLSLLELMLIRRLNAIAAPVFDTLAVGETELKERGAKIIEGLESGGVTIVPSTMTTGGGSLPDETFPSLSLRITAGTRPDTILKKLREASPPIIGIISNDTVHLNLATIQKEDIPHIRNQLQHIIQG